MKQQQISEFKRDDPEVLKFRGASGIGIWDSIMSAVEMRFSIQHSGSRDVPYPRVLKTQARYGGITIMAQGVYVSFFVYTNNFLAILKALQQTLRRRVIHGLELLEIVCMCPGIEMRSSRRQHGRLFKVCQDIVVDVFPVGTIVIITADSAAWQIREY